MKTEIGRIYNLTVKRVTPISYVLDNDGEEVFMHKNEAASIYKEGDQVDVFIFVDSLKRVGATSNLPIVYLDHPGILKVVSIVPNLGIFFSNGIKKEFLMDERYLPDDKTKWPQIGDSLAVKMKQKSRLTLEPYFPYTVETTDYKEGEHVICICQAIQPNLIKLMTTKMIAITVFYGDYRDAPRLGETVECKIKQVKEKYYIGTLIMFKEEQLLIDSENVLAIMKQQKGIKFKSDEDLNVIFQFFHLSKKAYKRAVGHLYKERLIDVNRDLDGEITVL